MASVGRQGREEPGEEKSEEGVVEVGDFGLRFVN